MWSNAVRQLTNELTKLHKWGVVHFDIKPENCTLDADGNWHLIDFGLARKLFPPSKHFNNVGTMPYICPLLSKHQKPLLDLCIGTNRSSELFNKRCDYFSFAITMLSYVGLECTMEDVKVNGKATSAVVLNIDKIHDIADEGVYGFDEKHNEIVLILAKLVLANVYTNTSYIAWTPKDKVCTMIPAGNGTVYDFDTEDLWNSLLKSI